MYMYKSSYAYTLMYNAVEYKAIANIIKYKFIGTYYSSSSHMQAHKYSNLAKGFCFRVCRGK
jgi:hypothetical protein